MHQLSLAVALTGAFLLGACATPKPAQVAQTPSAPASASPAAVAAKDSQNPVICARVETTGSRFSQKECHTANEWAAIRREGNDDINNRAQRSFSAPGGN